MIFLFFLQNPNLYNNLFHYLLYFKELYGIEESKMPYIIYHLYSYLHYYIYFNLINFSNSGQYFKNVFNSFLLI